MRRLLLTLAVAVLAFLAGCGSSDHSATTSSEATAVELQSSLKFVQGVPYVKGDPHSEVVALEELPEAVRRELSPQCSRVPQGKYPNEYECYTQLPEDGVRLWDIYAINQESGQVRELGSGILDPRKPNPIPPENYSRATP